MFSKTRAEEAGWDEPEQESSAHFSNTEHLTDFRVSFSSFHVADKDRLSQCEILTPGQMKIHVKTPFPFPVWVSQKASQKAMHFPTLHFLPSSVKSIY